MRAKFHAANSGENSYPPVYPGQTSDINLASISTFWCQIWDLKDHIIVPILTVNTYICNLRVLYILVELASIYVIVNALNLI